MRVHVDLTGCRFGRLLVLHLGPPWIKGVRRRRTWVCQCDCGQQTTVNTSYLTTGETNSCGCWYREGIRRGLNRSHGLSRTREFGIWKDAKKRCHNPNSRMFKYYGGRGIVMCDHWRADFPAFLADMGPCPPGLTLERRDNNGPYAPENCYWATMLEQSNNRRFNVILEFRGQRQTVSQWARAVGLPPARLRARLHRGWTVERSLTTPQRR